jgi:Fur family peroxide stress response transcriptional regulator
VVARGVCKRIGHPRLEEKALLLQRLGKTFIVLLKMNSIKQHRLTHQRLFVKSYLAKTYSHPTAQDIFKAAQKQHFRLGLTSVYRILQALEKEGLVIEIKSGGVVHYDYVRNNHYHFVCDRCGKIIDVPTEGNPFEAIAPEKGFHFTTIQSVIIHGLCDDCAKKK